MPKPGNKRSNVRTVSERGGSMTVVIPAPFAAQLGITDGTILTFEIDRNDLIVRGGLRRNEEEVEE